MTDQTLGELEKLEAKLIQLSDSVGRNTGLDTELNQARENFYQLKRRGPAEVGSQAEKKLAVLTKRCGYRLDLMQAVKGREWQTKRVSLVRALEPSSELARLLWEAITGQKPATGWLDEFTKPSFLCGMDGDNLDEVERMYRLLVFSVVFCAIGMELKNIPSLLLASSPIPIVRSAIAFASLELFNRADALPDIVRFPLSFVFPFSSRSGLEGDSFQTVYLLLRTAERVDAEGKCKLASTAFQLGSDLPLDEKNHLLGMIKAALLINRDVNDLLPIVRALCHGKPEGWAQSACAVLVKSITPEQLGRMLLTTKECSMIERMKTPPSGLAVHKARKAVMQGDYNQVCVSGPRSVSVPEIVKTELQNTLPVEIYGETAIKVPKLTRLICSGSKRSINQEASNSEIIEHLIKQPKLSSLSSYSKSTTVSAKPSDGLLTAAALASKVKQHASSNATITKPQAVSADVIKPSLSKAVTSAPPLTAATLKQKLFKASST